MEVVAGRDLWCRCAHRPVEMKRFALPICVTSLFVTHICSVLDVDPAEGIECFVEL
jgi:hypothetical protein